MIVKYASIIVCLSRISTISSSELSIIFIDYYVDVYFFTTFFVSFYVHFVLELIAIIREILSLIFRGANVTSSFCKYRARPRFHSSSPSAKSECKQPKTEPGKYKKGRTLCSNKRRHNHTRQGLTVSQQTTCGDGDDVQASQAAHARKARLLYSFIMSGPLVRIGHSPEAARENIAAATSAAFASSMIIRRRGWMSAKASRARACVHQGTAEREGAGQLKASSAMCIQRVHAQITMPHDRLRADGRRARVGQRK